MKYLIALKSTILSLFCFKGMTQQYLPNYCDSAVLTEKQLAKCRLDSNFNTDLTLKINYTIELQTKILPSYRKIRSDLELTPELNEKVKKFKYIYDSTLNYKLSVYESSMFKNQQYIQPKAYISTLLSYQLFRFYPDSYAILLNPVHLNLLPKTSENKMSEISDLLLDIQGLLEAQTDKRLFSSAQEIEKAINSLKYLRLLQGDPQSDLKNLCNIVNFLIWSE